MNGRKERKNKNDRKIKTKNNIIDLDLDPLIIYE